MEVKYIFLLCLVVICNARESMVFVCNHLCEKLDNEEENNSDIKCCYYEDVDHASCEGKPSQAPHLEASWSLQNLTEGMQIVLNISWMHSATSAFNESCGYTLDILRDEGFEDSTKTEGYSFRLRNAADVSPPQVEQVIFNFQFHEKTFSQSEWDYNIDIKSLPLPTALPNVDIERDNLCSCFTNRSWGINKTYQCESFSLFTEENPTYSTSTVITPHISADGYNQLFYVLLGLVGLVILGIVLLYVCIFKRNQVQSTFQKKIFVSISCEDADRSSWQSVAADQMCCFFQQHGSEVTYTLWHSTQLTQTNSIQWVCDEMEKNDHVILVLTPRALQQSYQETDLSESDPLLNRAYDPYRIVRKKMEAGGNNFSIVYFDPHLNMPPSLSCIKSCYQLPKDSVRLCRHLLACDVSAGRLLERSLQNRCEEMLIDEQSKAAAERNLQTISLTDGELSSQLAPESGFFTQDEITESSV